MNRTAFATLAAASLLAAAPAFAVETGDHQAAAPDVAGRAGATAVEDVVVTANRSAQPIYEYACHEGNHARPGILVGMALELDTALEADGE